MGRQWDKHESATVPFSPEEYCSSLLRERQQSFWQPEARLRGSCREVDASSQHGLEATVRTFVKVWMRELWTYLWELRVHAPWTEDQYQGMSRRDLSRWVWSSGSLLEKRHQYHFYRAGNSYRPLIILQKMQLASVLNVSRWWVSPIIDNAMWTVVWSSTLT